MSASSAELSSMAATLDDLVRRLAPIAERYQAGHREDLAAEALEIERVLTAGLRRLSKLSGSPGA